MDFCILLNESCAYIGNTWVLNAGTVAVNIFRKDLLQASPCGYLQRDLAAVANSFSRLYGQSLSEFISSDCSGDYKRLLIAVAGNR